MEQAKIDLFGSQLEQIEKHARAKNTEQLQLLLSNYHNLPLHEYALENSPAVAALGDKALSLMLELLECDNQQISESAFHNIKISGWSLLRSDRLDTNIGKLLPVLGRAIDRHQKWFLDFFDYFINFLESPHPLINAWLNDIEENKIAPNLQKNYLEAAKILYFYPRKTWAEAKYFLFSQLDHPDTLVRAYAANVLGRWYHGHDPKELAPALEEIIPYLTEKEIERPGIAGPFMSDFYAAMDLEFFERESGLNSKEWLFTILEKRKSPEPETLPCANGIDFYSHEIFSTPDEMKRLIKIGQIAIAREAAEDYRLDFKSILLEMENDDDPRIIRDVSFYLASYYHLIHPKAQNLRMIKVIDHLPNMEILLLNFDIDKTSPGRSILIYPKNPKDSFSDEKAGEVIEYLLPPSIRGAELHRSPWDDLSLKDIASKYPWTYITYANGSSVRLDGANSKKIWKKITIYSNLPKFLWDPESLFNNGNGA